MARPARMGLLFACVAGITACGGGGSSSPPPAPVAVPVAAALSSFSQASHMYSLTGSLNGMPLAATLTFTPGPSAMFQGMTTATVTTVSTITQNGATLGTSTSVDYITVSPFQEIGALVTAGTDLNQYTVDANWQALPATAMAGQSGSIDTQTTYADSTKTMVVSTTVVTWSVQSASSTTVWFCANSATTPVSGTPFSEADCYQMDASGNVVALKSTVQINGVTITLQ